MGIIKIKDCYIVIHSDSDIYTVIRTHQQNNSFKNSVRSMSNDIEYVINQLFKLLRRNLIEDPTDPSENQIIVDLFFVLGKCVSSSRGSYPSLLQRKLKLKFDS